MKRIYAIILPAIIALSILQGFSEKPSLSLTVSTLQMDKETEYNININGKRRGLTYYWTSSDDKVVEVNSRNGKIKALNYGQALISCLITDTNGESITLSSKVIVKGQPSNIIWEDDFNSETLDGNKWGYEYGYVRNFEMQRYTDNKDNVFIKDGHLVLRALKNEYGAWTSASVHTNNKLEIGNARIEARIKLPYENGVFPAFWMLGANYEVDYSIQRTRGDSWPEAREIDIIETFGKSSNVQGGVYFIANPGDRHLTQDYRRTEDIDISEFHTYALEKSDETIKFYYDDILYYTHEITDDGLKGPFYLLLNLAVGASGGTPDPDITEMEVMVDYVRITALEGEAVTEVEAITLDTYEIYGYIGDVKKVNVHLFPLAAQDRTVTWISSDTSIATVHGGYVRLLRSGTATISAKTANGLKRSLRVICY